MQIRGYSEEVGDLFDEIESVLGFLIKNDPNRKAELTKLKKACKDVENRQWHLQKMVDAKCWRDWDKLGITNMDAEKRTIKRQNKELETKG